MPKPTKIPGLSPESPLAIAGPLLVSARLADVRQYESQLSPAEPAMDVVHDMRVAARRLRAALTLLGDKQLASLEEEVKALQDALGVVRDAQVQGTWLQKAGPGGEAIAASVGTHGDHTKDVETALHAWSAAVAPALSQLLPRHAVRPGRLAGGSTGKPLRKRLARVEKRMRRVLADPTERSVHRLRIETKKLRYVAELVQPGYPRAAKALLRCVKPLLDKLGDLHDTDVRAALLEDARREHEAAVSLLHDVEQARARQADALLKDLRQWETDQLGERFQRAFRRRKEAKRLAASLKNGGRQSHGGNKEIERKFLVTEEALSGKSGVEYRQGYLAVTPSCSVRIRIANGNATLTIKGGQQESVSRSEWEYPIPPEDGVALIRLASCPVVEKTRYEVQVGSRTWEIDQFHGMNDGLLLGEVELEREDEDVELPPWVVKEVSDDPRYYNVNLAQHPYQSWADSAEREEVRVEQSTSEATGPDGAGNGAPERPPS